MNVATPTSMPCHLYPFSSSNRQLRTATAAFLLSNMAAVCDSVKRPCAEPPAGTVQHGHSRHHQVMAIAAAHDSRSTR
eukprot:54924-Chlamydomonas_euryale.AAC.3